MKFFSSADPRYLYHGDIYLGFVTSADAGICHNPEQHGKIEVTGSDLIFVVPASPISNKTIIPVLNYLDNIDTCPEQFPAHQCKYILIFISGIFIYMLIDFDMFILCIYLCIYMNMRAFMMDMSAIFIGLSSTLNLYTDNLEVGFDLRTIACTMSVNMGITQLSSYVQVLDASVLNHNIIFHSSIQ